MTQYSMKFPKDFILGALHLLGKPKVGVERKKVKTLILMSGTRMTARFGTMVTALLLRRTSTTATSKTLI